MTYKEALEMAIEELDEVIREIRENNWRWENIMESKCAPWIDARNVLRKELEISDVQDALLNAVERAVRKGNANYDIEEAYEEYEAKLKEKNT